MRKAKSKGKGREKIKSTFLYSVSWSYSRAVKGAFGRSLLGSLFDFATQEAGNALGHLLAAPPGTPRVIQVRLAGGKRRHTLQQSRQFKFWRLAPLRRPYPPQLAALGRACTLNGHQSFAKSNLAPPQNNIMIWPCWAWLPRFGNESLRLFYHTASWSTLCKH